MERSNAGGGGEGNGFGGGIVADYKVPLKRTSPSPQGFGGKENGGPARPPPSQPLPALPPADGHEQPAQPAKPSAPRTTYVSVRLVAFRTYVRALLGLFFINCIWSH
jgi:hypothetical protein